MLGQDVLAVASLGFAEHELALRDPGGLELRHRDERQSQQDDESNPDQARSGGDPTRDPGPHSLLTEPNLGGRHLGSERPEHGTTDDDERGGQEGQRREHGNDDADGRDRAEGARRRKVGEQEDQEAGDDGASGGRDRFGDALERSEPGPNTIRLGLQGIAEPGHDEEGIVRGGADDEDEEDALDLAVDEQDPGVGEMPDDEDRRGQRGDRGEEDDDRQQRRAVDDDEDDEDRDEGDEQEDPVDAGEGLGEVGGEAGGAGDVDIGNRGRGGDVAGLIRCRIGGIRGREGVRDDVSDLLDVIGGGVGGDGEDELEGVAVVRGDDR